MPTFRAIDPHASNGKIKEILERIQAELGMTPNTLCTLANSPAALEAYLGFSDAERFPPSCESRSLLR